MRRLHTVTLVEDHDLDRQAEEGDRSLYRPCLV